VPCGPEDQSHLVVWDIFDLPVNAVCRGEFYNKIATCEDQEGKDENSQ
jgi:hypothetical protein